jgi:hypothetical protein
LEGSETTPDIVFSSRKLTIIRVTRYDEIPEADRNSSVRISPRLRAPAVDFSKQASFIFDGDVSVDVGPLVESDEMSTLMYGSGQDLGGIEVEYAPNHGRPPPEHSGAAKAYVVGKISSYSGPDQQDSSFHTAQIVEIDLSPTRDQVIKFEDQQKSWRTDIEQRFKLSPTDMEKVKDTKDAVELISQRPASVFAIRNALRKIDVDKLAKDIEIP